MRIISLARQEVTVEGLETQTPLFSGTNSPMDNFDLDEMLHNWRFFRMAV